MVQNLRKWVFYRFLTKNSGEQINTVVAAQTTQEVYIVLLFKVPIVEYYLPYEMNAQRKIVHLN